MLETDSRYKALTDDMTPRQLQQHFLQSFRRQIDAPVQEAREDDMDLLLAHE